MPRKVRDYKDEYEKYQGKPEQRKNRSKRNQARREMMKDGKVHKGDNKDVNHKKPLSKGGSNKKSNLNVKSESKNSSYARNKKGGMKARYS
jgi:hypothetical protein